MEEEGADQPDGISVNQTKPMTKDKYKHAMEMLSAINSEQETEWRKMSGEWLPDKEPQNTCLDILNDPKRYRVKETPSKVPFGPEDIKPGMVFRCEFNDAVWMRPMRVSASGIHWDYSLRLPFEELASKHWQWSLDAITWHPCEKPSPPPPKREPRRVWVCYDHDKLPASVHDSVHMAKDQGSAIWCSESAVEFVEVVR